MFVLLGLRGLQRLLAHFLSVSNSLAVPTLKAFPQQGLGLISCIQVQRGFKQQQEVYNSFDKLKKATLETWLFLCYLPVFFLIALNFGTSLCQISVNSATSFMMDTTG
jgi:hypothetical protein